LHDVWRYSQRQGRVAVTIVVHSAGSLILEKYLCE
jgi:hypothetical protein